MSSQVERSYFRYYLTKAHFAYNLKQNDVAANIRELMTTRNGIKILKERRMSGTHNQALRVRTNKRPSKMS